MLEVRITFGHSTLEPLKVGLFAVYPGIVAWSSAKHDRIVGLSGTGTR
jgi:hypothetical protein